MEAKPEFIIRPATQQDVPSINAILTHYALNSVMTFATEGVPDCTTAAKLENITIENRLPFFVATMRATSSSSTPYNRGDAAIGICYISPYRPERLGYTHTGELSLFVHHEHQDRGVGSALLRAVLSATTQTRIKEVLAIMAVDDEGKGEGLVLRDYYKQWGFREVGTLEKVGFKFGRWIDVITLQLHVNEIDRS